MDQNIPTVEVQVGDVIKLFPAVYVVEDAFYNMCSPTSSGLQPKPQEGWRFDQDITGKWYGFRVA